MFLVVRWFGLRTLTAGEVGSVLGGELRSCMLEGATSTFQTGKEKVEDREAWRAAVRGVSKSRAGLSD